MSRQNDEMTAAAHLDPLAAHETLIRSLLNPDAWPAGGEQRVRIDTHISTVVLAGDSAYKIKKPLDLGFLDYSTLEKRQVACEEEVRLNRRLAPQIYLRAVAITGSVVAPEPGGSGAAIDWAVHMHRFDPDAVLAQHPDKLDRGLVEKLAWRIARFHQEAARCPDDSHFGTHEAIYAPMAQTLSQVQAALRPGDQRFLDRIADWSHQRQLALREIQHRRRLSGRIRECHGDLHLGNVALIGGEPVVFDGIEFSPELRWIDTMSDVAFLAMDLTYVGRVDLARWFLDSYLEVSGDYKGLKALRFYEVYRAMVRAKVAAIRLSQPDLSTGEREEQVSEFRRHMRLAEAYTHPSPTAIVITEGVAGAGKSTITGKLLDHLPAVRIRSDVERKRLAGIAPDVDAISLYNSGIYSSDMNERTYTRLEELSRAIVEAGFIAIVDATFLQAEHRRRFAQLAERLAVPFVILDCVAPEAVLRQRVTERLSKGHSVSDADVSVLEAQLRAREPLSRDERAMSIKVRPDSPLQLKQLLGRIVRH